MPPIQKDYYKILGVAPLASPDDIRQAFRLLSKKYHPDLNPDLHLVEDGDQRMEELVNAFNVLNDVERRKAYDAQPHFQLRRKKAVAEQKKINVQGAQRATFERPPPPPSLMTKLTSIFSRARDSAPSGKEPQVLDPKQSDVHVTLGLTLIGTDGLYEQARNEFKLAVRFDPTNRDAVYNLGLCCYKLGDFEEARRHFQRVLALERTDQAALTMLELLQDELR
ncbi:MAG: J domain-containing protein [Candidatus Xenobia bacterium]